MEKNKDEKTKLYIADNDEEKILEKYFEKNEKFKVVGFSSNGKEIIEQVKASCPEFLIMEVMLSGLDGFTVFETLKREMKSNCPKVIFVSSLTHSGFVSKAMNEGASYFMLKPVSPKNLEERILDLCKPSVFVQNKEVRQLDEKISNIFISIGIPAHIKGYQFLREAVKLAVEKPEIIGSITKQLYPTIAERFETSSSKVERGMRHAIEVAWNRGKIENINSLFGLKIYSSNEKPTNGELIALIADKMIMEG